MILNLKKYMLHFVRITRNEVTLATTNHYVALVKGDFGNQPRTFISGECFQGSSE